LSAELSPNLVDGLSLSALGTVKAAVAISGHGQICSYRELEVAAISGSFFFPGVALFFKRNDFWVSFGWLLIRTA
jgi:hypothetical protein